MIKYKFIKNYSEKKTEDLTNFQIRFQCCNYATADRVFYLDKGDEQVTIWLEADPARFFDGQELLINEISNITCNVCGGYVTDKQQLLTILAVFALSGENGLDAYLTSCGIIKG